LKKNSRVLPGARDSDFIAGSAFLSQLDVSLISEIAAIDPDWNGLVSQSALESIWLRESCALLVQLLASVKQFLESLVRILKRLHHFFSDLNFRTRIVK
jgi:hypothetical protein